MTAAQNIQLLRLSALIHLIQRGRIATAQEIGFIAVNDTAGVVPFQQAALWRLTPAGGRLAAVSGVPEPEPGAPYGEWLTALLGWIADAARGPEIRPLGAADVPRALAADWPEWFPPFALWCPLTRKREGLGGLLIGRAEPFTDGDRQLMAVICNGYADALLLAERSRRSTPRWSFALGRRRTVWLIGAAALIVAALPIRQSVLAPAEVVPVDPAPVRAPFDGMIDHIDVEPNAAVRAGQKIVTFDTRQLQSRYQVTAHELEIARAEYSEEVQKSIADPRSNGKLAVLQSRIQQKQIELAYVGDQLRRAEIPAPSDGIAVFDDRNEWVGKPVTLGERIMVVASPSPVEVEAQVPVADVVNFDIGAEVLFYGNLRPDRPVRGRLTFASYAASPTAEGVLAYRFRARVDGDAALRLGLKGTAEILGPRRPLLLLALRKPIAVLRQWLSL